MSEQPGLLALPGRSEVAVVRGARALARVSLVALTVAVAARRIAGALSDPLDAPTLFLLGVLLAAAAAIARAGTNFTSSRNARSRPRPLDILISALLLIAGAALSLPGSSVIGLAALWLALLAEEVWSWATAWRLHTTAESTLKPPSRLIATKVVRPGSKSQVIQTMTRRRSEQQDVIEGTVRIEFAAGQRTEVAHLAFCPPLSCVPDFELEQTAGPLVRLKETQLFPYGVRIEARLNAESAHPESIVVRFAAADPGELPAE